MYFAEEPDDRFPRSDAATPSGMQKGSAQICPETDPSNLQIIQQALDATFDVIKIRVDFLEVPAVIITRPGQ